MMFEDKEISNNIDEINVKGGANIEIYNIKTKNLLLEI